MVIKKAYNNVLQVDVLILDDCGLVPLSSCGPQDLYGIISDPYEQKSTIIINTRVPEESAEMFGNNIVSLSYSG